MKDYYLILEIGRDATREDIHRAHRRLVIRYHPGQSEEADVGKFREVHKAYEVLRDSERRREYNDQLKTYEDRFKRQPLPVYWRPVSFGEDFETIFPGIEEILHHIRVNFFGPTRKVEPVRDLNLEVILDPDEAFQGVTFPLEIPVYQHCPRCNGRGGDFPFPCLRCDGEGWELSKGTITTHIPPGVLDGTVLRYALQSLGIKNLWLTITVRIQSAPRLE